MAKKNDLDLRLTHVRSVRPTVAVGAVMQVYSLTLGDEHTTLADDDYKEHAVVPMTFVH